MIDIDSVRNVLLANMPFDKGYMMGNGLITRIEGKRVGFIYDTVAVPYIVYQNEGFTHYISGNFIKVHQGFVDKSITEAKMVIAHQSAGFDYERNAFRDLVRAKTTLLENSTIQQLHVEKGGEQYGNGFAQRINV